MRRRIDAETDYNIMADLALGLKSKDIAKKYGVSVSYISKVRTGKKKINVYIPEQAQYNNKIAYYASDIDTLEKFFDTTPLSLEINDYNTLDGLIINKLAELKVLLKTRKILKEKAE